MNVRFRKYWTKRPLFVLSIAVLILVVCEGLQPGFSFLGRLAVCLALLLSCGWRAGIAAVLLGLLAVMHLRLQDARLERLAEDLPGLGVVEVEGRLVEDGHGFRGKWRAVVRLHGKEYHGAKVSWAGNGVPLAAGSEVKATGYFHALEGARNPGTLDRGARLRNEGVVAVFQASEMRSEEWTGPISQKAWNFKQGFRRAVIAGLDEESAAAKVIHAVVLGERADVSLELIRRFRESGTLHVFTVSGLHVAMLGSLVWLMLQWFMIGRRVMIPLIIAAMFGYVWLTGNGPAAMRAAWMGAVFLGAFVLRRQTDLLNSLGTVLLAGILIHPRMILMPGVQLSYGVVAMIGLATPYTMKFFSWIKVEEAFLPASELGWWRHKWLFFRQRLADSLAVSTAAWLGSAPLTMIHFGLITPISTLATVALVMQVYVLLGLALISATVYPIWEGGSKWLNRGNAVVAEFCADTAGFFAALPGASSKTRIIQGDTLVIYDLDYGSSAACFTAAGGSGVLLDSGGRYALEREVGLSLQRLGMNPDSVVFTHSDSRHIVGPELLCEMFPIRQVAMGATASSGSVALEWEDYRDADMRLIYPGVGDELDFGDGVKAEVLLSPHQLAVGSAADDRCLIFRVEWKGWKLLWLSDAGRLSEQKLLESGVDLASDLIVAGLHESDVSLTPDFVRAVAPRGIVIGRPAGSDMDSIRMSQIKTWEEEGIVVLDQQQSGGLTLTIGQDGELVVAGFLDGSRTVFQRGAEESSR